MIKVFIIGFVGKTPELRYAPEGKAVTQISVASNEGYNDKKYTVWVKCTAWEKTAENAAKYLVKGSQVFIEGELSPDKTSHAPRMWTDDAGVVHATYDVTVRDIKFLSKSETTEQAEDQPVTIDESIPF